MKKALLISNFYPPEFGGIQNYLHNLVTRLPEDKIAVLTDKQVGSEEFDKQNNHPIYRRSFTSWLRRFKMTSLALYIKTLQIAKKENVQIMLVGNLYLPALTCYWIKKINKLPYYIFTYGTETTELWRSEPSKQKMAKKILTEAEGVITISDYLAKNLSEHGVAADKITKICPGVDYDFYKPQGQDQARTNILPLVKKHLAPSQQLDNSNILLSVGRLVQRKGHDMVIKSLPAILQNFPKTLYLIVGDGPHKKSLQKLAQEIGVEPYVMFLSDIKHSDLPAFYNACDIFLMPSRTIVNKRDIEGFGIVYLEASACAKPVIAGRGGGVTDAVKDERTGLLVDPEKPAKISQAVIKLLNDAELAKNLGQAGRQRVKEEFNWDELVKKLQKSLV